jgi:hypothetical protein
MSVGWKVRSRDSTELSLGSWIELVYIMNIDLRVGRQSHSPASCGSS